MIPQTKEIEGLTPNKEINTLTIINGLKLQVITLLTKLEAGLSTHYTIIPTLKQKTLGSHHITSLSRTSFP